MLLDSSSSSSSSSSEDDFDVMFMDSAFSEPRVLGPRINLEDVGDFDCEQMFR